MRKAVKLGAGLAAAAAILGFGLQWWVKGRFVETTDDAYLRSDISIVAPKVAGYVKRIAVAENQHVSAGDVLVVIDDEDFAATVAQAAAQVTSETAAITSIDSQLALQETRIAEAKADISAAEADRNFATADLARYRDLARAGAASQQHFDTARMADSKAAAAFEKASAALAQEERQTAVLKAGRTEAEAKLKEAQATEHMRQIDLANTVIRAPVDGIIGNKGVDVGQYVKAGTQLFALVPDHDLYIVANYKETQIGRMRPGQPVEISVDAFSSTTLTGRVESFAPASGSEFSLLPPENATGNFTKVVQRIPVRIAVPLDGPLGDRLRPGMSVVARVNTREGDSTSTAPPEPKVATAKPETE
jgi:membrane fusion protein (multidrug efflux system)